jgi:hypothetical protein
MPWELRVVQEIVTTAVGQLVQYSHQALAAANMRCISKRLTCALWEEELPDVV